MFFTQEFIYLCNMKNFLFILTLLFGMLLFVPEDVQNNDTTLDLQVQKEAVMIEKGTADKIEKTSRQSTLLNPIAYIHYV